MACLELTDQEENKYKIENKVAITPEDFKIATTWSPYIDGPIVDVEESAPGGDKENRTAVSDKELDLYAKCEKFFIGSQGQLLSKASGINPSVGTGKFFYDKSQTYPKPQFILTCAHNFMYKKFGKKWYSESTSFFLRQTLSDDNEKKSDATTKISHFHLYPKYDITKEYDFFNDIAIGVCEENLSSHINKKAVFVKDISKLKIKLEIGRAISLVGYPHEHDGKLYYMTGTIAGIFPEGDETLITYTNIQTSTGQSGSPVYVFDSDDSWIQIAVHLGYSPIHRAKAAVAITESKFKWIEEITSKYTATAIAAKSS